MLALWVKTLYIDHFCLFLLLYFLQRTRKKKKVSSTPQEPCSQATMHQLGACTQSGQPLYTYIQTLY